jgi:hypothetical protein
MASRCVPPRRISKSSIEWDVIEVMGQLAGSPLFFKHLAQCDEGKPGVAPVTMPRRRTSLCSFAKARANVSGSHIYNFPQHAPSFSFMLKGEVRFEKEGEDALDTL